MVNANHFTTTRPPCVAIAECQTAFALVKRLQTPGIGTKVKRNPALARLIGVRTIGRTSQNFLNILHLHACLELGELATQSNVARDS